MLKLYDYYRSSSCYRVRIALYHKKIPFEIVPIDLVQGQQRGAEYMALNPSAGVPLLVDGGFKIAQSPAILEYLEEAYPQNPLLPKSAKVRAYIRQMAMIIATDIHPLNNLKVWKGYVGGVLGADDAQQMEWYMHWMRAGFDAYEALLEQAGLMGRFTYNDHFTLADLYLVPQLYNARRFHFDLSAYPRLCEIEKNCMELDAVQRGAPESHIFAPEGLEQIHGKNAAL